MKRSSLLCLATAGSAVALAVTAFAPSGAKVKVYTITAHDYSYDAPQKIGAGLVTLRLINKGAEWHHAALVRLDGGHTLKDAATAMQGTPETMPPWVVPVGGPNAIEPNREANATLSLKPGNYALVCFVPNKEGKPHMALGMARPITVVGPESPESPDPLPAGDVKLSLTDYAFKFSKPLTAGRHVIHIRNDASQLHEIVIGKLQPGKTEEDVQKWLMSSTPTEAPAGELIGGLAPIAAKGEATIAVDLPPGDYLLVCFVPDARDGKPHLMHGMVQRITVS